MSLISSGYGKQAGRLIRRLGRDVTLRTYTNSGTDFDPTRTASDQTVKAAVFKFREDESFDGSIIERNDMKFVIASAVTVTKQDKIVDDGKEYHIVGVENIGPGDNVFYYNVRGRL